MKKVDRTFLIITSIIILIGVIMFTSASLGILNKNESKFYEVVFNQFAFGLGGGIVALYLCTKIPYQFWRKYSLYIFIFSIILSLLVFVPKLGFSHGGAKRWISLLGFSFQPVEFLKIGFIIYFASWLSWTKNRVKNIKFSIIPLLIMSGIITFILLKQPDTKSIILIMVTAIVMLFVSGTPVKYLVGILTIGLIGFAVLVSFKPYLIQRVKTFVDPSHDPSGSSYQLQQSLIAIGSGGIEGRGLGQGIQKFNYLPEPQGDSIFAVIGEELGFIGSTFLILLFIIFTLRGFRIGYRAPNSFTKLLVIGLITIIIAQAFMNIASTIGVFPLTGVPLPFISHGGTSLMIYMGVVGIILQISRQVKK
ncbi:MAG: putative lipid II flippase FtsW [Patescibacteria group bacterium]|nr:putative lipid II flippase FtsW [Patescibacteria group bacterium]